MLSKGNGKDCLGVAIQDQFLDDEWSSLVMDDVLRYSRTEKMTETSFSPQLVSDQSVVSSHSINELVNK
jgi:hypothetical protein